MKYCIIEIVYNRGRIVLFGYITFYRDELKIKDYDKFRAYYCGLCKELGKRFNQLVRLGLSYDFTFLALLLDSLEADSAVFANEGCLKHLGKKRATVKANPSVEYAAHMSVVLMYFKLLDDVKDDFSVLSAIAMLPYWFAMRKARKAYPQAVSKIKAALAELSALEKARCANTDEAAHAFAVIMEELFDRGGEELKRLGYNLGRFIYIADAANDYEKDVKKNKYNPYRYAYPDADARQIRELAGNSMLLTLAMTGECYEKLDIKKNKELIDNIIYMGLRKRMDTIVYEKGNSDGKSV